MPQRQSGPLFISLHADQTAKAAIESQYNYLEEDISLGRSTAHVGRTFNDFDNNISVKSDFNRSDFEYFRANTLNLDINKIIDLAQKAYERVGVVRNTIDTMSNLGCQGIRIQHPVRKTERFLEAWFSYVGGPAVSEQFLNMLYRLANVPIKSAYGTINYTVENEFSKTKGDIDSTEVLTPTAISREIPLKYSFIYPNSIEAVGGNLSLFLQKPVYALKLPPDVRYEITKLARMKTNSDLQKRVIDDVNKLVQSNSQLIALDQDKFDVYFYKKNDWDIWAMPMIRSILNDLIMLERMKLADSCALDGAISNIRLWRVGIIDPSNPNNNILPTKNAINKIKDVLANNIGGGTMDLVTGPEVDFKESSTQVHHFLGSEKYEVTLNAVYDGLGIPPPLRSHSGSGGNATNNYVSLKTLVENLKYGRSVLTQFWNKQLKIVQLAMGDTQPGQVMFDQIILADESAEKKLLIELADRDIISSEAVREYFGFIPEIEKKRVKRDFVERDKGKTPPKASQFHNPMLEDELVKVFAQAGDITPSQAGLDLEEPKPGETTRIDKQAEQAKLALEYKTKMAAGRPKGVSETSKRKKKAAFKARAELDYFDINRWTEKAYNKISEIVSSTYLTEISKANLRQLNTAQVDILEKKKFIALCNLPVMSEDCKINLDSLSEKYKVISSKFDQLLQSYLSKYNEQPTLEEKRKMQIMSYVEANFTNISNNVV